MSVPVLRRLFVACRTDATQDAPASPIGKGSTPPPTASPPASGERRSHRQGATPASEQSPTDPALRANPSPKVTDPICRLPLPTLFHRLEAVHLGDLLRLWVRPDVSAIRSLGFSRAHASAPDAARGATLGQGGDPISGQSPSRVYRLSKRKENSSRDSRRRLRARTRRRRGRRPQGPNADTAFRFGNVDPIPFRDQRRPTPPRAGARAHWEGVNPSLRTDSPTSKCCSRGTLPHFSLQSSHLNRCYYHQDLHRRRLHRGPRTRLRRHRRALLHIAASSSPATAGVRCDASAPSIFRAG